MNSVSINLTDCNVPAPDEAYWVPHFKKAAGHILSEAACEALVRKLRVDSLCSNLGSELGVFRQLAIPHEKVDCCERNQTASSIMIGNYRSSINCCYKSIVDHSRRQGDCGIHGSDCSYSRRLISGGARVRRDLVVVGSPCQPWSGYDGRVSKDCTAHELFPTTFGRHRHGGNDSHDIGDSVYEFVQRTNPHALLLEQIPGFGVQNRFTGGKSALELFLADMYSIPDPDVPDAPLFCAHATFRLDARIMVDMCRSRIAFL